jgi:parallel beta-helix repeat protein
LNRVVVVVVLLLFVVSSVIPISGFNLEQSTISSPSSDTLYVGGSEPGNYTKIQDAIGNATEGDTVFVFNGTYFENVVVDKSINLIGEDKDITIISGSDSSSVVVVTVNMVNITGFTIRNGYNGIEINSNYNTISNTTTISNGYAIELREARYNTITGNEIISNRLNGIYGDWNSDYNVILGNIISDNKYNGITLGESSYNTIKSNNISNNRYAGIFLCWPSGDNIISDNSFFNNGLKIRVLSDNIVTNNTVNGKPLIFIEDESNLVLPEAGQIILINCDNISIKNQNLTKATVGLTLINTNNCLISNNIINSNSLEAIIFGGFSNNITENTISGNRYGIKFDGSNNTINENTISINKYGIYATYNSYNNTIYHNNFINNIMNAADERNNTWDNGKSGNFWDDYTGEDNDGDGIGDTPYPIPGGYNEDRFPLIEPWDGGNQPPEIPKIEGKIRFKKGEGGVYSYVMFSTDPDGDYVCYLINWSNGTQEETGFFASGENITLNVTIPFDKGTYFIFKIKAKDVFDEESDWSILEITVPKSHNPIWWLNNLLDRFPLLSRLLGWLM